MEHVPRASKSRWSWDPSWSRSGRAAALLRGDAGAQLQSSW